MTLSVSVMSHPTRAAYVSELVDRLDVEATIVWDTDNNRWHTGRRSLLAYDPNATHHLVLQDDAVIPPDLHATCLRILEHTPANAPVSLYMGRNRHRPFKFSMQIVTDTAKKRGASFAVFGGPWFGVAVIVPTTHVEGIVKSGDAGGHKNYDIKIAQYFKAKRIPCWYTMPSVVDHREGPSLIGQKGTKRQAMWWEPDTSGVDWGRGSITPSDMGVARFPQTP